MKQIAFILLIFILFYSCDNKQRIKKELQLNGISDVKYLLEYIEDNISKGSCIQPDCFNHCFNYLRIIPLKDTSMVFVRNICLKGSYESDFLLQFEDDSIKIYKPLLKMFETALAGNQDIVYSSYLEAIENKKDSFEIPYDFGYNRLFSYYKKYESGIIEFESLWKSRDNRYFLYFEYDNVWKLFQSYAYEKTIKNNILNPLPIFCIDSDPCCPLNPWAYPTQKQADKALQEVRKRLW